MTTQKNIFPAELFANWENHTSQSVSQRSSIISLFRDSVLCLKHPISRLHFYEKNEIKFRCLFLLSCFLKNKLVVTQQSSPAMAERRLSFYFSSGCLATHPFFFLCIVTTAFVNEDCNHKKKRLLRTSDFSKPVLFIPIKAV